MSKISTKMSKMLNDQFGNELYAANLYLSMSSYFKTQNLEGFANFFLVQSGEEHTHSMKIFKYLHDVESSLTMPAIAKPVSSFKSIKYVFEITLQQEKLNSLSINKLVKLSLEENDYATHTFLQWFITEQVEEEASINRILEQIIMIGSNKSALFLMDKDLGQRQKEGQE